MAKRHGDINDAICELLEDIGRTPDKEQEVPRWNTADERARLDIVLTDARLGEVCIDVSVVATITSDAGRGVLRGIERREKRKHNRYPGRGLYPVVVDVRGKWGKEAHALIQAMAGSLPREKRAEAIRACRRKVAVALQAGIANHIHSAGKPLSLSAEISYTGGRPLAALATVTEDKEDEEMATTEDAEMFAEERQTAAGGG